MLVVGNGLAMDQRQHTPALAAWNTQAPLSWNVPNPGRKGPLIDALPVVKEEIQELQAASPGLSDFEMFTRLADSFTHDASPARSIAGIVELRHLILQSFALYTGHAEHHLATVEWPWGSWITANAPRLRSAVSFNYDLVLESLLERYPGVQCGPFHYDPGAFVVVKPHGSVDYTERADIIVNRPRYPLIAHIETSQAPLRLLPRGELRRPRHFADVVIPGEESKYSEFGWVRPGRAWARAQAKKSRYLVFLGLSYWPVDRRELDEISNAADPSATVIVANPYPDPLWLEKLRHRFSSVRVWTKGPEPLPS